MVLRQYQTKGFLHKCLRVQVRRFGTLPGGIFRDKFGPKAVSVVAGIFSGIGLLVCAFGQIFSYKVVLIVWCIGCFFCGFTYNVAITTCNKWFPDHRNITIGLISAAFSWGALPFIFPIRSIPEDAPDNIFFNVIFIMAAIIAGVIIITGLLMKDPPKGWSYFSPLEWQLRAVLAGLSAAGLQIKLASIRP
ncbi:MFS transporter [Dickeya dianthicola]|uniref:MFS transporter n=1 Tax=Dickeya dianthicola TaxID=204039 RepID=UPI003017FB2F